MMGTKIRNFAPLPDLSLEELVPKDGFYRHLEAALDLSFVSDLVRDCYASSGRPSERRSGSLLPPAAGDVLRGHPLRAKAHGGRGGPFEHPLVAGLRSARATARPL